jgi:hypothetical protein
MTMPHTNGLVSASVLAMLLVGAFSGAITGLVLANMAMNQVWLAVISALIAVVIALLVGRVILRSSIRLRLWSQVVIWNAIVASLIGGLAGHELSVDLTSPPSSALVGAFSGLLASLLIGSFAITAFWLTYHGPEVPRSDAP